MTTTAKTKREVKVDVGGVLEVGDFISVAYSNSNVFGWFVEAGQYGSLKFLTIENVIRVKQNWDEFNAGKEVGNYWKGKFSKGFNFKAFRKDFIVNFDQWGRVMKHPCPEDLLAGSTYEAKYAEAKEFLNLIKFPAK